MCPPPGKTCQTVLRGALCHFRRISTGKNTFTACDHGRRAAATPLPFRNSLPSGQEFGRDQGRTPTVCRLAHHPSRDGNANSKKLLGFCCWGALQTLAGKRLSQTQEIHRRRVSVCCGELLFGRAAQWRFSLCALSLRAKKQRREWWPECAEALTKNQPTRAKCLNPSGLIFRFAMEIFISCNFFRYLKTI